MYIRVRIYFFKIAFRWAFDSPSWASRFQNCNFLRDSYISRIILLQILGSPVVKFENYYFQYSHLTYQKTRIGLLNSNIEYYWEFMRYLSSLSQYASHGYIWKKYFQNFTTGSQTSNSNYSRNIKLRKKIKTVLKFPGPGL